MTPRPHVPIFQQRRWHSDTPDPRSLLQAPTRAPKKVAVMPTIPEIPTIAPHDLITRGLLPPKPVVDPHRAAYESLASAPVPKGFKVTHLPATTEADGTKVRTSMVEAGGKSGYVERAWNPATKTFEMRNAFLDDLAPEHRSVNVGGRDMRTQDYLTQMQAHHFGIGYGGIENIKMSTIQNVRTVARVAAGEQAGVDANEAFKGSQSYDYAARFAQATGHDVDSATLSKGGRTPFDRMLEHYETGGRPGGPRNPARAARHDKILADEGVKRSDKVYWNFNANLGLKKRGS